MGRVSRAVLSAGRREAERLEVRGRRERGRRRARHVVVQITGAARAVHQAAHRVACGWWWEMRGLPLEVRERRRVVRHVGEHQALLVVILAQDLVVAQVEPVAHAEPMVALLASEALEVVDVAACAHHHLEGRDHFVAGRAVTSVAEQPQIVPLAQNKVSPSIERVADLPEAAVTAAALQAVLMPQLVQSLQ